MWQSRYISPASEICRQNHTCGDSSNLLPENQVTYACDRHTFSLTGRPGPYVAVFFLVVLSVLLVSAFSLSIERRRIKAALVLVSSCIVAVPISYGIGYIVCGMHLVDAKSGHMCDRCDHPAVYMKPGVSVSGYGGGTGRSIAAAREDLNDVFYCTIHAVSFRHFYLTYAFLFLLVFFVTFAVVGARARLFTAVVPSGGSH